MTATSCKFGAMMIAATLAAGCDAAPAAPPTSLRLGVTAHFAQGWPEALWPTIASVHAGTVREALGWRRVEQAPGRYIFTAQNSGYLDRLCQMKIPVVLVIEPRNPLYDNGATADSANAQTAFGAFVAGVADHFGNCLAAIEVGNEINGAKAMTGPAAINRAQSHTRLMKAVWQAAKPRHPDVAILGGSVNTVGTGFLEQLFAQGLLDWVDGIAIHPYRRTPEGLDWEVAALRAAMARHGTVKPLWATEFGVETPDPATATEYLMKMAVLLSASGIAEAQWYALADDPAFPTMGLIGANAKAKPAASTFSLLATELLARGPAIRLSNQEPAIYRFRFGGDREVLWGAPRSIVIPAGAIARDSRGERVAGSVRIGSAPIIVDGPEMAQIGPREVLADSLYDYAQPVWIYSTAASAGAPVKLRAINSNFATTLGAPKLGPVAVNPLGMILPAQRRRMSASLRYSMPVAGRIVAQACLLPKSNGKGAGEFEVLTGHEVSKPQVVPPTGLQINREVAVQPGDTIDFVTSAHGGPAVFAYRFRIALAGTQAAQETLRCS